MTSEPGTVRVYLEVAKTRTFAGSLEWPGWCRGGRGEDEALRALVAYGPRYAAALRGTRLGFRAPRDEGALAVVERLEGDASTDFGAPGKVPSVDTAGVDDAELRRLGAILRACWRAFDGAVEAAEGKELRKGPRGGGRELDAIVRHVLDGDRGYLTSVGWKVGRDGASGPRAELDERRRAILEALTASARGEVAPRGPRGGVRWPARYFVRRVAWHVLDHAWEIEDRVQ